METGPSAGGKASFLARGASLSRAKLVCDSPASSCPEESYKDGIQGEADRSWRDSTKEKWTFPSLFHGVKAGKVHSTETRGRSDRWSSCKNRASSRENLGLCERWLLIVVVLSSFFMATVRGFGAMSSIAISSGEDGLVCAIAASGKQEAVCWSRNSSDSRTSSMAAGPPLIGLSGGRGFICGLKEGTSQPFCWRQNQTAMNAVLEMSFYSTYISIAAGANHACAVRSSMDAFPGAVDCWPIGLTSIADKEKITTPPRGLPPLREVVAGNNYSCGLSNQTGHVFCWGISMFNASEPPKQEFGSIASGPEHVCGILKGSSEAKCWGDNSVGQAEPPTGISFVALAGGYDHTCGIRKDSHEILCWGSFNLSALPQKTQFLAITSAHTTCGVREDNLLVDCWGDGPEYHSPVQLFNPGLCSSLPCKSSEFYLNASSYGVPNLRSLCFNSSKQICAPCARICPAGYFLSSPCMGNSDGECTPCSLCQNEMCETECSDSPQSVNGLGPHQALNVTHPSLPVILGAALSGGFVVACLCIVVLYSVLRRKRKFFVQSGRSDAEIILPNRSSSGSLMPAMTRVSHEMIRMQAFRLALLREATSNFKEINELGRGSYGIVYKAVLPDGRQVAVKRANAARRIHINTRDFEAELEILCKVRHAHLVNLLGYCDEMGERLLVYEFMPHGTLHDHLHGGLSPLSWGLRLKIAMQAAQGVEFLHKDASPRILHGDIKSSNILLDGDWGTRVADFGLFSADKPLESPVMQEVEYVDPEYYSSHILTEKSDVYSFGVVLLELLSGRKPIDMDFNPPNIKEWAAPLIRQGISASILDRSLDLPKNVEPLLRVADIAEQCVRPKPDERPTMSEVATWLEQVARGTSTL